MDEYTQGAAVPPTDPTFDPNDPTLFPSRPKWPKVVGLLSVVFGSLGLMCGGLGPLLGPVMGMMAKAQLNGAPLPPSMRFNLGLLVVVVLSVTINAVLVLAGVLAMQRKPVSRFVHLGYAVVMVPLTLGLTWWQLELQDQVLAWAGEYSNNPIAESMLKQHEQMGNMPAVIGAAVGLVISLAWPLFCMLWFGLVKPKASQMTGEVVDEFDPSTA